MGRPGAGAGNKKLGVSALQPIPIYPGTHKPWFPGSSLQDRIGKTPAGIDYAVSIIASFVLDQ